MDLLGKVLGSCLGSRQDRGRRWAGGGGRVAGEVVMGSPTACVWGQRAHGPHNSFKVERPASPASAGSCSKLPALSGAALLSPLLTFGSVAMSAHGCLFFFFYVFNFSCFVSFLRNMLHYVEIGC